MTTPAIDSTTPGDGSPEAPDNDDGKISAWSLMAMRKRLPSELSHKAALRWPDDVNVITGIPSQTLKELRANGDTPRLYAIGRALFTTHADLRDWFVAHELAPGQKLRAATIPKGTKRPVKATA